MEKGLKVTVAGKEYPCRQTMGAMLRFKRETGREVTDMTDGVSDLCTYLYCCVGREAASRPARIEGAGHGKAQEADVEEGLTSAELVRQCLRYGKYRRDKAA